MSSNRYPTDLSDAEWSLLEPHLPVQQLRGRPHVHSPREILNAVFYVLKTGCQWRLLPREFPPWKTVFHYFRTWRIDGTWESMNRAMRRQLREELGRDPEPSAAIVDSQSVKTTGVGGEQRGFLVARRYAAGRGICSWIPKVWWSKPKFTARRCPTKMASSVYSNRPARG